MARNRHGAHRTWSNPNVVLGTVPKHRRVVATKVGFQISPADHAFLAFFGGHRRV
jgi:hypothetical protein